MEGQTWQNENAFDDLLPGIYNPAIRRPGAYGIDECFSNWGSVEIEEELYFGPEATFSTTEDCGDENGSLTISASGGNPPYWYQLGDNDPVAQNVFSNLSGDTYSIKIFSSDQNGDCQSSCYTEYQVDVPLVPINVIPETSLTNPDCQNNNGVIEANFPGLNDYILFKLFTDPDDGSSSQEVRDWQTSTTFTGLVAGTYKVQIKERNEIDCSVLRTIFGLRLENTTPNIINATIQGFTNCLFNDAQINLQTDQTDQGYFQYRLNSGPWQSSPVFSGLSPGNYTAYIKCQNAPDNSSNDYSNINISGVYNGTESLNIVSSLQTTSTCESSDGKILIYSVKDENNSSIQSFNLEFKLDNGSWQPAFSYPVEFSNLAQGTFTVYARYKSDEKKCIEASEEVEVEGQSLRINSVNTTDPVGQNCEANPQNGSIEINAVEVGNGSGSDIIYSIDGGNNYQLNSTFSNLSAGIYTIQVAFEGEICVESWTEEVVLNNPREISISNVNPSNPTACGLADGSIEISMSEANNWEFILENTEDNGIQTNNNGIFTALPAGTYEIRVKDLTTGANECTLDYPFNPITLTEPCGEICGNNTNDDNDEYVDDCEDPDCMNP